MILLDTVTVSETSKRSPSSHVIAWLRRQQPRALYLSVVTVGEIERGIEMVESRDLAAARRLRGWHEQLQSAYADRLVVFDVECALIWGSLSGRFKRTDRDLMIAATALRHGWSIATRNVTDFEGLGIDVIDPWAAHP